MFDPSNERSTSEFFGTTEIFVENIAQKFHFNGHCDSFKRNFYDKNH